jgi:glycolate oxidase iron-sulfur subunit
MRTRFAAAALADPEFAASEKEIRKCVHCGFCLATCPTYLLLGDELDSPRGRIVLMQDMLEKAKTPSAEVVLHIDRCLSCLACSTTCPSGVDYGRLVDHARAYIEARHRRPWPDRFWRALLARVLPDPQRLRRMLFWAPMARPAAGLVGSVKALAPLAAMLRLAPRRLTKPTGPRTRLEAAGERPRVAMLDCCVEGVLRPEIGEASVRLLERTGFSAGVAAGTGCCGALAHHLGRRGEALTAARTNVGAWSREIDSGGLAAIVATASGCGTMIKDYGFLLRDDAVWAAKAQRVSALAKDVCELIEEAGPPAMGGAAEPLDVAYLAPCSLQHGQRAAGAAARLLAKAGFKVVEPQEAHLCCGSAGAYNILQSEISGRLRDRKAAALRALNPAVVAAGNIGCLSQIGDSAGAPAVHPVELLDWASGGPRPPRLA